MENPDSLKKIKIRKAITKLSTKSVDSNVSDKFSSKNYKMPKTLPPIDNQSSLIKLKYKDMMSELESWSEKSQNGYKNFKNNVSKITEFLAKISEKNQKLKAELDSFLSSLGEQQTIDHNDVEILFDSPRKNNLT